MRPDLVPRLDPPQVSWMSVKGSDDFSRLVDYDLTWRDTARKFEMVTMPYQDFAGMNESLELLRSLGTAAHDHIRTLTARLAQGAAQMRSVARVIPAETRRSGIVCVVPQDPVGVSRRLTEAGVVHSLREGGIRLSPHCYNTVDEVDAVLDVLRS
jgi:cysteine desulfurase / selenocysteine lyase